MSERKRLGLVEVGAQVKDDHASGAVDDQVVATGSGGTAIDSTASA